MADNNTPAPNQAATWDELSTKFKNVGINDVTDYEGYLTACYKSKGELRLEDWDLVADHLKKTATGQSTGTQTIPGQKKVAKPQEASNPDKIGFWYGDVTADGQKAQFADEDRRLAALKEMLRYQWVKQHPGEDPSSDKAREEYFGNVTFTKDNPDPFHAWTTTYIAAESAQEKQAKELLKKIDAVGYTRYEQNEKTRVYPNASRDPAYISAVLSAKEKTRKAYDQSLAAKKPMSREQVEVLFANEQLVSLYEFAKAHPEKARAYSKNYPLIRHAASLQRVPDMSDLYTVIRAETLTPSIQVQERRRQGAKFLYAKMAVLEDLAKKDPSRAEQLLKEREKYGIMAERIMAATEADVDKEIARAKTVLETNPLSLHDAAVLEKLAPPVAPADNASASEKAPLINPYDAVGAIAGTTINLKKFLKPSPPASNGEESGIEEIDEEYEGDQEYEDAYQERIPDEDGSEDSDDSDDNGGGDRGGNEEGGESEGGGGDSGNNRKRKKSLYEQQNNLRRRYKQLKRGKGLAKKGTNMVKNAAKNAGKKAVSAAEQQAKKLAAQAASRIVMTPHFWIGVLIVIVIILIIALIIYLFSGSDDNIDDDIREVVIVKNGPVAVENGEQIDYSFTVSYPAGTKTVTVTDKIPDDTEFINASNPGTYNTESRTVTWRLESLDSGLGGVGSTPFDVSGYYAPPYLLPFPSGDSDVTYTAEDMVRLKELGNTVEKYQSYLEGAVSNPNYVEPFASVIWSGAVEGINGDRFFWNCNDVSGDINAGCEGNFSSGDWQVGYGIQVSQAINHLEADFNAVYGEGSANNPTRVQEVGQKVIVDSGEITNPSTFPTTTISSLVSKARNGDAAAQQAVAVLLMDQELGAVSVALEVGGDIAREDNWRATMESFGDSYKNNMQKFSNRMQAIAQKYTSAAGSVTLTLSLKSLKNDTYVINQAAVTATGVAGEEEEPSPTPAASEEDLAPNDENCAGVYLASMEANPLNKNFGDPSCSLAPNGSIDKNVLGAKLEEIDPGKGTIWLTVMIPCAGTDFNPNYYFQGSGPSEWGFLAMGGSDAPAEEPRGGVQWIKQIKNAVAYNNTLRDQGQEWSYWGCTP